ncbi:MAG: YggS family pyridoxal phosphate-dependent enzyme [SAR324 cluster bacterium]|uniref:Pyridoxal phosphate homeostasis protein n=1 Tax=SAR324 cluster bacterium TaxID=2024889 RepID=A0A2A4T0U4_9DELT|nr:MAG: YggS family pyridoxal phosphate-dependent enzyme [SAR324 cluster bacterium]
METITERLAQILERIKAASGDRKDVKLIAVSKTKPVELILQAFQAGQRRFGENRVQEARDKHGQMPAEIDWHLIGPLQKNKAKYCPSIFSTIHSLHRMDVAEALNKKCLQLNITLDVLFQMNLTEESTKSGLTSVEELQRLADQVMSCEGLRIKGLMTIGNPLASDRENQALFASLYEINQKEAQRLGLQDSMVELSTGMSSDFELALKEGATYVRVGSAIFGKRNYSQ